MDMGTAGIKSVVKFFRIMDEWDVEQCTDHEVSFTEVLKGQNGNPLMEAYMLRECPY